MNKVLKWLIVIVPFVLIIGLVSITALLTNKAKEVKIVEKDFTTKDSKVTIKADEKYTNEDKGEYDLYLIKNNKQVVGVFSYDLSEYEEKTAKEVLDKQVNYYIETRKNMKIFKKEESIDMDDKVITKVEYSGKTDKSSECIYIFSVIAFKSDPNYILYVNEVILKSHYEENISEMIDILKSAKLN